jgi:hypothetical protein
MSTELRDRIAVRIAEQVVDMHTFSTEAQDRVLTSWATWVEHRIMPLVRAYRDEIGDVDEDAWSKDQVAQPAKPLTLDEVLDAFRALEERGHLTEPLRVLRDRLLEPNGAS